MNHKVGYLIGSHVGYERAMFMLLESMTRLNGIDRRNIVVSVNGASETYSLTGVDPGPHVYYRTGSTQSHFATLVNSKEGQSLNIDYWFFLNCTSKCGPNFKMLVESGFDPDADATIAGALLSLGRRGGVHGRAINDMAMYRYSYLIKDIAKINLLDTSNLDDEGILYAHAPKQAQYPRLGMEIWGQRDVYNTGTIRSEEYYPGIDLHRYKKNWGQLPMGSYQMAAL